MQIPSELLAAVIGGFVGSLVPVVFSYLEKVRRGQQLRTYLAKEIEFNSSVLFEYGVIAQDIDLRIVWYENFRFDAWKIAESLNFCFLSEYEQIYVLQIYEDARFVSHLVEHLNVYTREMTTALYRRSHIVSQINDYCSTRYCDPRNNRSHKLVQSLKRKINLMNYYPVVLGWAKFKIP